MCMCVYMHRVHRISLLAAQKPACRVALWRGFIVPGTDSQVCFTFLGR